MCVTGKPMAEGPTITSASASRTTPRRRSGDFATVLVGTDASKTTSPDSSSRQQTSKLLVPGSMPKAFIADSLYALIVNGCVAISHF